MSCNVYKLSSAASLNVTQIGSTDMATILKGYVIQNTNAATRYVKFYWGPPGTFSSSGFAPTPGTDVPKITVGVPAPVSTTAPGQVMQSFPDGIRGAGNMFISTNTGVADTDSAAVGAGDLLISIFYE